MKKLLFIALLFTFFSCHKVDDDTGLPCTENCTTVKGRIVTKDDMPLANIPVSFRYTTHPCPNCLDVRKIAKTKTDSNGNYEMHFYIQDNELLPPGTGYFDLKFDTSGLNTNQYITSDEGLTNTFMSIQTRDTVIVTDVYIPKMKTIKVHLNGFQPQATGDRFEVRSFFPSGFKYDVLNAFTGGYYGTGSSGFDNYLASGVNNTFDVMVAEGEDNIIYIAKITNGVHTQEEHSIAVPDNPSIELTYDY